MQCHESLEVHHLYHLSLAEFVQTNGLLKRLARNETLPPLEYLASSFVPECRPGETYRSWLIRQLGTTLRANLRADAVLGFDGTGTGRHTKRYLAMVTFDAADEVWVERTFGKRQDVLLTWQEAQSRLRLAA
jgi:hypothetical protein